MYRKGPAIALIRAADHRRRQAAKANLSLCSTKRARCSQHRRLLAPHRHCPDRHRFLPISAPRPASPGSCHRQRSSGAQPAPRSALQVQTYYIGACISLSLPLKRICGGPRAWRRGSHACARPPAGRMLRGRGQVRARRGGDHEVALSARGCRRRQELSKVKVTNRLFPPSRSRFQAFPVLSSPHSSPRTFPPRHGRAGQRPPPSQGPAAGLHFPARAAALAAVSSRSSSPSPAAKPLFNITETFIV